MSEIINGHHYPNMTGGLEIGERLRSALPDAAAEARRNFARVWAQNILVRMPFEQRELWLAHQIENLLTEYQRGLEQLCNHYAKLAYDALATKLPDPIILPFPDAEP
jgi:hypothetical protein